MNKRHLTKLFKISAITTLAAAAGGGLSTALILANIKKTKPIDTDKLFNIKNGVNYGFKKDITPKEIENSTINGILQLPSCETIAANAFNAEKYSKEVLAAWPEEMSIDVNTKVIEDYSFFRSPSTQIQFYKVVGGTKVSASWEEWQVRSIGKSAFAHSELTSIGIPMGSAYDAEVVISERAFYGCRSLSEINLTQWDHCPTKVGYHAFSGVASTGEILFNNTIHNDTKALIASNFSTDEFGGIKFWESSTSNGPLWKIRVNTQSTATAPSCHPIPSIYLEFNKTIPDGFDTGSHKGPITPIIVATGGINSEYRSKVNPSDYNAVIIPSRTTSEFDVEGEIIPVGSIVLGVDDGAFTKDVSEFTINKLGFEGDSQLTYIGNQSFKDQPLGKSDDTDKTLKLPGNVTFIGVEAFSTACAITELDISEYIPVQHQETNEIAVGSNAFNGWLNTDRITSDSIVKNESVKQSSVFREQLYSKLTDEGGLPAKWTSDREAVLVDDKLVTYQEVDGQKVAVTLDFSTIPDNCNTLSFGSTSGGSENPVKVIGSGFAYDSETQTSLLPETITRLDLGSSSLTTVGAYAFAKAAKVKELNLSSSITTIGDHAFAGCVSLSGLSIPASLNSVGDGAFEDVFSQSEASKTNSNWLSFANLTEDQMNTLQFGSGVFKGLPESGTIYWPENISKETKSIFSTKLRIAGLPSGWFTETEPEDEKFLTSYVPEKYLIFKVDEKTGTKELYGIDWTQFLKDHPNYIEEGINTLYIPSTVKTIAAGLCYSEGTTVPKGINSLVFAKNSICTSIGAQAFKEAPFKGSLTLPTDCTTIGAEAFYSAYVDDKTAAVLTIPANCSIDKGAFCLCSAFVTLNASNMDSDVVQQWMQEGKHVGNSCFGKWNEKAKVVFEGKLSQDEIDYLTDTFVNDGDFPSQNENIEVDLLTYTPDPSKEYLNPRAAESYSKKIYTTQAERAELLEQYIADINEHNDIFQNDIYLMLQNTMFESQYSSYFNKANGLVTNVVVSGNRVSFDIMCDINMYIGEQNIGQTIGFYTSFNNLRITDISQNSSIVTRGSTQNLFNVVNLVADEETSVISQYNYQHWYEIQGDGSELDMDATFGGYNTVGSYASESDFGIVYNKLIPGETYFVSDLDQETIDAVTNCYESARAYWFITNGYSTLSDIFSEIDEGAGEYQYLGLDNNIRSAYFQNACISADYLGGARLFGYTNNYGSVAPGEYTAEDALYLYKTHLNNLSDTELIKFLREDIYYGISARFMDLWDYGEFAQLHYILSDVVQITNITYDRETTKLSFTIQFNLQMLTQDGANGVFGVESIRVENLTLSAVRLRAGLQEGQSRVNVYWKGVSYGESKSDFKITINSTATLARMGETTSIWPTKAIPAGYELKYQQFAKVLEDISEYTSLSDFIPWTFWLDLTSADLEGGIATIRFHTASHYLKDITLVSK